MTGDDVEGHCVVTWLAAGHKQKGIIPEGLCGSQTRSLAQTPGHQGH